MAASVFNAYSKFCQISKMDEAYWELWHSQQFIQVFSGIFRNIQPCSGNWGMFSHIQTYSELCVTLAFAAVLEPATSSKTCQRCKMIRHNKSLIVNSFILGLFWYIFSHTYRCSTTGELSPASFWKLKKVSLFWKQRPWFCTSLG